MAKEFNALNENDTAELRKRLDLPITKELRYFRKEKSNWVSYNVTGYEIVDTYQPSNTPSLLVSISSGEQIRIISDYFSEMQKNDFAMTEEKTEEVEKKNNILGKRLTNYPKNYIVYDIETTGKNHKCDEIIEIAAIRYTNGKEVDRIDYLVKPKKCKIPFQIEQLTGITNEMVEEHGVSLGIAMLAFYDFVKNDILVGHNITSFDNYFVDDAYLDCFGEDFSNDYVDTKYLAKDVYPTMESVSLKSLSELYNIDYSKAHRAIEDCEINHKVYEYLAFGNLLDVSARESYSFENDKTIDDEELDNIGMDELPQWGARISNVLKTESLNAGLFDESFRLLANISRKTGEVSSYSICITERDIFDDASSLYSNQIVGRIKKNSKQREDKRLRYEPNNSEDFINLNLPRDCELRTPEKTPAYILVDDDNVDFYRFIVDSTLNALKKYKSNKSAFACCSRYEKCSNEGKCIHPNLLYSTACAYRSNLERGNAFLKDS